MINLEDHTVYIDRLKMDMVPLSIAKQALEEQAKAIADFKSIEQKLDESIKLLNSNMEGLNPSLNKLDD
jgi:ABC-type polysaccharide/polyol phosphate transport system ATPase subunit